MGWSSPTSWNSDGWSRAAAGGAPTASGWDPTGVGTNIALSTTTVPNDTATNSSGAWNALRGTSAKTTGKLAFEINFTATGGTFMLGLIDQTTAGGAAMTGQFSVPNGIVQWNSGTLFTSGADFSGTTVSAWSPASGDVYGVQADLTSGKVWFSKNGVSLGGDPVAGTGNPGTIANNHLVCPSASIITNPTVIQLITGTLTFPVTGYSAWGP